MANRQGKNRNSGRLYSLGSKITADCDSSQEIKRSFLLGRKTMTNLDSILKIKDITLQTKLHIVKALVFPVVMHRCEMDHNEGWTLKNWCFCTVGWRWLFRVPWTARSSNQSVLKEINPGHSLERLMLMVKLQYIGHLMQRANQLEMALILGMIEGNQRKGWQRTRCFDGITNSMDMSLNKLRKAAEDREAWWAAVHDVTKSQTGLNNNSLLHHHTSKASIL